jgi:hypothetical protein
MRSEESVIETGTAGGTLDDVDDGRRVQRAVIDYLPASARTPVGKPDLDKLADGHTVLVALKVSDTNGQPVSDNLYWCAKQETSLRELNGLLKANLPRRQR